ncbi:hypothetical protein [Bradyrhizobium sp. AUGA SZCCT0182]|uniref:hypothetical protein n=1 Tax=Bradyrhizobium sp. AUGA SZCCT0182 TaxID=2807667 RepID=UPI001BAB15C2|nr:hypothetical protein [Bradyrhizobium sp. AUGA SZCCT0182]MBR1233661.1 hypothetical protein [Bradyrhizobium sp. AUGA SZCCT0182]
MEMASRRACSKGNASFSGSNHRVSGVRALLDLPPVIATLKGKFVEIGLKAKK